jgi:hypothetical protein
MSSRVERVWSVTAVVHVEGHAAPDARELRDALRSLFRSGDYDVSVTRVEVHLERKGPFAVNPTAVAHRDRLE